MVNHYRQIQQFRSTLCPGVLLSTMDFGQNYLNLYQDKPQGQHWMHLQMTMFNIVNQYVCPQPNCHQIVKHEQLFFTGDIKNHNHYTITACTEKSLSELHQFGVNVKQCVHLSDNCSEQFKSKGPFLHLTRVTIPMIYCYFGARHRRSLADRVTAVAKKEMVWAQLV